MQNSKVIIQRIPLEWIIVITIMICISSLITSCDSYEEDYTPGKTDKPVLKTTAASVELKQKQAGTTAFTLSWTAGSNDGTNSGINYTIEIDQKGNNFSGPYSIEAGKGAYNNNFNVENLNNLLRNDFSISAGAPAELEFRIVSQALDTSVDADTSNVVSITMTPYEPLPIPATLYMVGDATPNGWDNANPTAMTRSANDASVFSWQGQFSNGELKFITDIGTWLPSYQKGADDTSLLLRTDFGQPDEKFKIAQAGLYKVTVDVIELSFAIEALAVSPFSELWIVGSAVPKGWDIDHADMMVQSLSDPFVFSFNEVLTAGEFKIATAKNWGAEFYRPTSAAQPITETDIQLSAGDPDYKWTITEPGPYKITLDLRENTISIKPYTPYENLWMVGDAGPAGWNIAAPEPMTKSGDYTFTWTGQLNAGEFKFPIATGDWGTGYFMPYNADESINQTLMTFRPTGSPDTKWRVKPGEEGVYKITLDQLHHTISIEKQ